MSVESGILKGGRGVLRINLNRDIACQVSYFQKIYFKTKHYVEDKIAMGQALRPNA